MKRCYRCKELKDESEFYVRKSGRIYSECKQCSKERTKEYYRKCKVDPILNRKLLDNSKNRFIKYKEKHRETYQLSSRNSKRKRAELQNILKKEIIDECFGGGCKMCGYNKCLQALDLHHTNGKDGPEKCISVIMKRLSIKNMKKENVIPHLDGCICVCKNCHAEIHSNDGYRQKIQ